MKGAGPWYRGSVNKLLIIPLTRARRVFLAGNSCTFQNFLVSNAGISAADCGRGLAFSFN